MNWPFASASSSKATHHQDESFRNSEIFHARGGGLSRNQDTPQKPPFDLRRRRRLFRLLIGSGMLVNPSSFKEGELLIECENP
jgi:hypothetical protein